KRRRMHYLDMFTRHFNSDLLASIGQTHMFTKEFSDEYELTRKRYYKAEGERIFFECGYDMYLTFDEINDLTGMKLEMYR
ncbi:MAG: hypothetical protein II782_08880, partial [Oscillospiraceae bacterium]|nr:hypothetical protein [Oscillospiraceae bacterium]